MSAMTSTDGSGFVTDQHGQRRWWSHYELGDLRCDAVPVLDERTRTYRCPRGCPWSGVTVEYVAANRLTFDTQEREHRVHIPGFRWDGREQCYVRLQSQDQFVPWEEWWGKAKGNPRKLGDRVTLPLFKDDCTCSQEGDFCPVHPNCVCGCPKHAHRDDVGCMRGKLECDCKEYRPQ